MRGKRERHYEEYLSSNATRLGGYGEVGNLDDSFCRSRAWPLRDRRKIIRRPTRGQKLGRLCVAVHRGSRPNVGVPRSDLELQKTASRMLSEHFYILL